MASKCIDVKVAVWQRLEFGENANIEHIIEELKKGNIQSICTEENEYWGIEWLDETEQLIPVEHNSGYSTVQVYNSEVSVRKPIWENGKPYIDIVI